jgi:hypothetical protein
MSTFTLRVAQPFRLASTSFSRTAFRQAPIRAFHSSKPAANTFFSQRTAGTQSSQLTKLRNAFQQQSRTYIQETPVAPRVDSGNLMQKLLVGGAMFGGTLLGINMVFNRETREDGGMPPYERAYLNQTFMHTGLGIGIIGMTARAMYQSGFVYRLMATNPWVVMIGGLALSVGTMMGTRMTDPKK